VSQVLELIGGILAVAGALACIIGGIGLLRLPDFFSRTHAASVTDSLGAALVLVGLVIYEAAEWFDESTGGASMTVIIKLLLLLAFIYVVSPTASHALAKAAFAGGLKVEPTPAARERSDPETRSS